MSTVPLAEASTIVLAMRTGVAPLPILPFAAFKATEPAVMREVPLAIRTSLPAVAPALFRNT